MSTSRFVDGLPSEPGFETIEIRDRNRLAKTVRRRTIHDPNEGMREIHKRLIKYLRDLKIPLPHATGGVPGGSPVNNVSRHLNSRFFYITDISHAYGSTDIGRLVKVLIEVDQSWQGQEEELKKFLEDYCSNGGNGLRIGFPASPDLFNIYSGILLDKRLEGLIERHNLVYSRYLDDLVFSSNREIGKRIRQKIRVIITEAGFEISHHKTRVLDITKKPIVINGIGLRRVSESNRIFLPRHFTRRIVGIIRRSIKRGDIKREVVTGHMGVLINTLREVDVNSTENRVLTRYRRWREITGGWKQPRLIKKI